MPYKCKHENCTSRFKTKKQNLIHHNNLERECKSDRENIILLIHSFKKTILNFISKNKISGNTLKENELFTNLKSFYDKTEETIVDPDFFFCTLGENFLFLPK